MRKLPQREYLEVIGTKVREVLYGGRNWRLGESGAEGNGIGGCRWPWKGVWAREIDKEG